jgi:hypothetical protein
VHASTVSLYDNKNFASWEQKDKLVTGYFIDKESKICRLKDFSKEQNHNRLEQLSVFFYL